MRLFPHRLIGSALGCLLAATLAVVADAAMPPAAPAPAPASTLPEAAREPAARARMLAELRQRLLRLRQQGGTATEIAHLERLVDHLQRPP